MKRRTFLGSLGATLLPPPLRWSSGLSAFTSPATSGSCFTVSTHLYGHALSLSRSLGDASPDRLATALGLSARQASILLAHMSARGHLCDHALALGRVVPVMPAWMVSTRPALSAGLATRPAPPVDHVRIRSCNPAAASTGSCADTLEPVRSETSCSMPATTPTHIEPTPADTTTLMLSVDADTTEEPITLSVEHDPLD